MSDEAMICDLCDEPFKEGEAMRRLPAIGHIHQDCEASDDYWDGCWVDLDIQPIERETTRLTMFSDEQLAARDAEVAARARDAALKEAEEAVRTFFPDPHEADDDCSDCDAVRVLADEIAALRMTSPKTPC